MTNRDNLADLREPTEAELLATEEVPGELEGFGDVEIVSLDELEPDFSDDLGAVDPMLAAEEGEPWFPPTDPVIVPESNQDGGARVVGGLGPANDEEFRSGDLTGVVGEPTDDELVNAVYAALEADALTSDLEIEAYSVNRVVTLRGEVRTLQDAEAAEAVTGRVPGVVDVQEELTVETIE